MNRSTLPAIGMLAAGAIVGGILFGTLSANAATGTSSSGTSSAATSTGTGSGTGAGSGSSTTPPANSFSSTPVRSDEKAVSSTLAASLTAKAEAKTGGTVYRVETDAGDGAYEAHVKKSDGTLVTVKFDSSGNITAVEDGMGKGDPAPAKTGTTG